jgi:hypothetical protein
MKTSEHQQPTIAIIVTRQSGTPVLAETLMSSEEILEIELALLNREPDPLKRVQDFRKKQSGDDEEFADFVEGLLSQPFVKPDVQAHAVQWFQKAEDDASRVIATYAFQVYANDFTKTDFLLAGPRAKVRIKVIDLSYYQKPMAA